MSTHAAYNVYFDKLCDLLINRDKFDVDILEDNDFTKRIIEIKLYLKGVRRDFIRDSSKCQVLLQLFASEDEIKDFWDPAKYNEFLDLWDAAVSDGFLSDCVCHSGPAPSILWDPVLVTPVKAIGKQCVTSGPKGPVVSVPLPSAKPGFTHLMPLLSNPGSYIQRLYLQLIPPPHKYNKLSLISSKGVDRVLLCHVPPFQVHSLPRTSLFFQPRNPNGLPQLSKRFTT
jgi:hypothetical protein